MNSTNRSVVITIPRQAGMHGQINIIDLETNVISFHNRIRILRVKG